MKKEVKELINRNFGDINDTIQVIDQMILIYSILKIDKPINKAHIYNSLLIDLQELKTEMQIQQIEYKRRKNEKK